MKYIFWTVLFLAAAARSQAGEAPVALGSAAKFGVLAGATVTSTGETKVTGDLGVGPGGAVTGFPPGIVNGTIHASDPVAAQAEADLTLAFNDAAGRTTAPATVAGNLGGLTLTPGLYKSTSSLAISSGDLTLDAQGDANAVFLFQMASTLTTTAGRKVILAGGARAANIYWQVGTSATLGTDSVLKGNILADQSITLNTRAALEGRALARIGAVALDANTITVPATLLAAPSFGPMRPPISGAASLVITNTPGFMLSLQSSEDLMTWTTFATPTPSASPSTFTDPNASAAKRFYRAFYP